MKCLKAYSTCSMKADPWTCGCARGVRVGPCGKGRHWLAARPRGAGEERGGLERREDYENLHDVRFREHSLREEVRGPKAEDEVPRRQSRRDEHPSRRDEHPVYVRVLASIEREVKVSWARRAAASTASRAVS